MSKTSETSPPSQERTHHERQRVTVPALLERKKQGTPIVMVTAYDACFAKLIDACDVDIVLVGDSLGMVMQGHQDTLQVTLDEMIYHSKCVKRGLKYAHLTVDLPFMTYQLGPEQALRNAGRLLQEGGAESVKLEGGGLVAESVRRIVGAGIPVMGHVGLTPQSVHAFGGFKVQGREPDAAERIKQDALRLQDAGCFSIVVEGVPAALAEQIRASLEIPTIGIGAGVGCDGQVLVMHDLLGLEEEFKPKFVKRFGALGGEVRGAVNRFAGEVRRQTFPSDEFSFVGHGKKSAKNTP